VTKQYSRTQISASLHIMQTLTYLEKIGGLPLASSCHKNPKKTCNDAAEYRATLMYYYRQTKCLRAGASARQISQRYKRC